MGPDPSGSAQGAIDAFAQTRADIQTRNTYSTIASGAMKLRDALVEGIRARGLTDRVAVTNVGCMSFFSTSLS